MGESVASPLPYRCVNCDRPLGIDKKIAPVFTQDAGGETAPGQAKQETWCPTCFVFVRAHRDLHSNGRPRYAANHHPLNLAEGMMRPILCKNPLCGIESLHHGNVGCLHCPWGQLRPRAAHTVLKEDHFQRVTNGKPSYLEKKRRERAEEAADLSRSTSGPPVVPAQTVTVTKETKLSAEAAHDETGEPSHAASRDTVPVDLSHLAHLAQTGDATKESGEKS